MKLLALTGTLALVAALPNNVDYEDSPIALEASYEDGAILGGASPYQKCNKQCKKAFKAAIRHQNKYSQYVSQACQDLFLIKSFPESYATQVVAIRGYGPPLLPRLPRLFEKKVRFHRVPLSSARKNFDFELFLPRDFAIFRIGSRLCTWRNKNV